MKKIQKLIMELPNKDSNIAQKLLDKRDFSSLNSLVWSDILKVERAQRKKDEKYKDIDLRALLELKVEVDKFDTLLYGEEKFKRNFIKYYRRRVQKRQCFKLQYSCKV